MEYVSDILNGFWGGCLILRTLVNGQYGLKFFEIYLNFELMTFLKLACLLCFPNPSKTECMTIYNEIHLFIPRFYLMMSISKKLNRTNTLVKSTNKLYAIKSLCKIGQMRKVKFILDRNCLQKIYFSFVRPTLEYSGVIWGNIPEYLSQENRKYSIRSSTNCDRGWGGGG